MARGYCRDDVLDDSGPSRDPGNSQESEVASFGLSPLASGSRGMQLRPVILV